MSGEVNGLYPTPARLALLRAIHQGHGRIYFEPGTGEVYDHATAFRVTERVRTLLHHEWIRALEPAEPRAAGEMKERTYYRLTAYGRAALEGHRR